MAIGIDHRGHAAQHRGRRPGSDPGLPKVHLHNPVLAYEVGDDFMKYWYQAERRARPVRAGAGRLHPQRRRSRRKATGRRWAPIRHTGQPITTNEWIDRLAPKAFAVVARAHAPPTAASMPWQATRRALWAWPITWAGSGSREPGCPSSTCPVAPFSPTISWRPCSTCSTRPQVSRR